MRFWSSLCIAAAVFPLLLVAGSRAGLIIAVVGIIMMVSLNRRSGTDSVATFRQRWRIWAIPMAVGAAAILSVLLMSRGLALQRLLDGDHADDRIGYLPQYLTMIKDFFPFGSGMGSFDPIYRSYEPTSLIMNEYLNHAHNDIVEIAIEAGAPAILLLFVFLGWFAIRALRLWKRRVESSADILGRAGSAMGLMILLSSFVDYPLRTPAMAAMMALACCWMLPSARKRAQP
jgi:O-antigen ligase